MYCLQSMISRETFAIVWTFQSNIRSDRIMSVYDHLNNHFAVCLLVILLHCRPSYLSWMRILCVVVAGCKPRTESRPLGTASLILSAIGLIVSIVVFIVGFALGAFGWFYAQVSWLFVRLVEGLTSHVTHYRSYRKRCTSTSKQFCYVIDYWGLQRQDVRHSSHK